MGYEIRAMSFAEIMDTGFRIVRQHFGLIIGIAAALYVPVAVLRALVAPVPVPRAAPWAGGAAGRVGFRRGGGLCGGGGGPLGAARAPRAARGVDRGVGP